MPHKLASPRNRGSWNQHNSADLKSEALLLQISAAGYELAKRVIEYFEPLTPSIHFFSADTEVYNMAKALVAKVEDK